MYLFSLQLKINRFVFFLENFTFFRILHLHDIVTSQGLLKENEQALRRVQKILVVGTQMLVSLHGWHLSTENYVFILLGQKNLGTCTGNSNARCSVHRKFRFQD